MKALIPNSFLLRRELHTLGFTHGDFGIRYGTTISRLHLYTIARSKDNVGTKRILLLRKGSNLLEIAVKNMPRESEQMIGTQIEIKKRDDNASDNAEGRT